MSIFSMIQGKTPIGGVIGQAGGAQMLGYDPGQAGGDMSGMGPANNALAQPAGGVFNAVKRGVAGTPAGSGSQADALARSHGFPDAATMLAWQQHRQDAITGGSNTTTPDPSGGGSFLSRMMARIPIHPAFLIGKAEDAMRQANGQ